jgi:hypothetical protein
MNEEKALDSIAKSLSKIAEDLAAIREALTGETTAPKSKGAAVWHPGVGASPRAAGRRRRG